LGGGGGGGRVGGRVGVEGRVRVGVLVVGGIMRLTSHRTPPHRRDVIHGSALRRECSQAEVGSLTATRRIDRPRAKRFRGSEAPGHNLRCGAGIPIRSRDDDVEFLLVLACICRRSGGEEGGVEGAADEGCSGGVGGGRGWRDGGAAEEIEVETGAVFVGDAGGGAELGGVGGKGENGEVAGEGGRGVEVVED
jgi:hypothetical protein